MYCLKCRKKTEIKNLKAVKPNQTKPILLSIFAVCGSEKSRFIKEQEPSRFLEEIGKAVTSSFTALGKTFAS